MSYLFFLFEVESDPPSSTDDSKDSFLALAVEFFVLKFLWSAVGDFFFGFGVFLDLLSAVEVFLEFLAAVELFLDFLSAVWDLVLGLGV